jgi:hypothetical protein
MMLYFRDMGIQEKIRLDANNQTLYFPAGCADAETCRAVCCRNWNVLVSITEEASGMYEVDTLCICTNKPCVKNESTCLNRRARLKRRPDGSCVYLDDRNRCSMYSSRPVVCRTFTCENGWNLSPLQTPDMKLDIYEPSLDSAAFKKYLRMDCVFVKSPLVEFKASFYSGEDREIVLIVKRIDKCGTVSQKFIYDNPVAEDEVFSFIIDSFDGIKNCAEVRHETQNRFGIGLSDRNFLDIILVLQLGNLIVFKKTGSARQ